MESMEGLVVHSLSVTDTTLSIGASPCWLLLDISNTDEVCEFTVEQADFSDDIFHSDRELVVGEYDLEKGTLMLWDEWSGNDYLISGIIRLSTRWYTKEEIVSLVQRMKLIHAHETTENRQLKLRLHEVTQVVIETFRRSEMRLAAGKPVHLLKILEHIKQQLKAPFADDTVETKTG